MDTVRGQKPAKVSVNAMTSCSSQEWLYILGLPECTATDSNTLPLNPNTTGYTSTSRSHREAACILEINTFTQQQNGSHLQMIFSHTLSFRKHLIHPVILTNGVRSGAHLYLPCIVPPPWPTTVSLPPPSHSSSSSVAHHCPRLPPPWLASVPLTFSLLLPCGSPLSFPHFPSSFMTHHGPLIPSSSMVRYYPSNSLLLSGLLLSPSYSLFSSEARHCSLHFPSSMPPPPPHFLLLYDHYYPPSFPLHLHGLPLNPHPHSPSSSNVHHCPSLILPPPPQPTTVLPLFSLILHGPPLCLSHSPSPSTAYHCPTIILPHPPWPTIVTLSFSLPSTAYHCPTIILPHPPWPTIVTLILPPPPRPTTVPPLFSLILHGPPLSLSHSPSPSTAYHCPTIILPHPPWPTIVPLSFSLPLHSLPLSHHYSPSSSVAHHCASLILPPPPQPATVPPLLSLILHGPTLSLIRSPSSPSVAHQPPFSLPPLSPYVCWRCVYGWTRGPWIFSRTVDTAIYPCWPLGCWPTQTSPPLCIKVKVSTALL